MTELALEKQQDTFTKGMRLVALQEANNRITDAKNEMVEHIEITKNPEDLVTLRTRLALLEKDPEELNEEEMKALFEGIDFQEGFKVDNKFKLSFLQLVLSTDDAISEMNEQQIELDKSLKEFQNEMGETIGDPTSETDYFYKGIREALELSEKPESKKRFEKLLHSMDESFDHTDLIKALALSKPANFFYDYSREERQLGVYARYRKVADKLNIKSDILSVNNLEEKLPGAEMYKDFPNIFAFAVIRFVSYKKDLNPSLGLYIARTVSNIQNYKAGRLEGEYKERFEQGVSKVIDTLIKSK